jgi:uncharacterized protein YneF (UPF0154 family)
MVDGISRRWLKIAFLFFPLFANIFSYELKSSADRTTFTLGDPIHFRVMMELPDGVQCVPPEPEKLFGPITVREWNINRIEKGPKDTVAVDYILTSYVPENCTIPSLPYLIQSGSSTDTLYTEKIALQFLSVITAPPAGSADTTIDIKDLKAQQVAGTPPRVWLWILIITGALAIITILAMYLSKKFKKKEITPPPVPPYEEAILALGVLHGKRLLEKGLIREYVFELSEIFKRYIERRFETNASEFTTEEMIAWAGASALDKKLKASLEWFFRTTDPVKFARIIPDSETINRFPDEVTRFLESTRPLQQPSEPSPDQPATDAESGQEKPINQESVTENSSNVNEVRQ